MDQVVILAVLAAITAAFSIAAIVCLQRSKKSPQAPSGPRYQTLSPAVGPRSLYSVENEDCWAVDDEFDDL